MLKLYRLFISMVMLSVTNGCAANQEVGGMTAQQAFSDPRVAQLVEAAVKGDFEQVDAQIQAGADVNTIGKEGITPLIWQVYLRKVKATEKLLQIGANPNYRDQDRGSSALYLAIDANRPDILEVLLLYKGDANLEGPYDGDSLLDIAISRFGRKSVELLLQFGADANVVNAHGISPARSAVALGEFDIVNLLLDHGLSKSLQDLALSVQSRDVPPDSAVQEDKNKVIELLKARGVQYPDPRYSPPKPPPGWKQ